MFLLKNRAFTYSGKTRTFEVVFEPKTSMSYIKYETDYKIE